MSLLKFNQDAYFTHGEIREILRIEEILEGRFNSIESIHFERDLALFIKGLPDNCIFYDIGSCIGYFSILAAHYGHKVFAFEPDLANFEALTRNCNRVKPELPHISIFKECLADKECEMIFNTGTQPKAGGHHKFISWGSNDLAPRPDMTFLNSRKVRTIDLDSLIERKQLPLPDVIKIDVDGAELLVLGGAKNALKNAQFVHIELLTNHDSFNKAHNILRRYGYIKMRMERITDRYQDGSELMNCVFIKKAGM